MVEDNYNDDYFILFLLDINHLQNALQSCLIWVDDNIIYVTVSVSFNKERLPLSKPLSELFRHLSSAISRCDELSAQIRDYPLLKFANNEQAQKNLLKMYDESCVLLSETKVTHNSGRISIIC